MKSPTGFGPAWSCSLVVGASWVRTSVISLSFRHFGLGISLRGYGSGSARDLGIRRSVDNDVEAAPEHPFAIERDVTGRLHTLVFHDLFPSLVVDLLRGPFDESEDDGLVRFGFDGPAEVRNFTLGNIIAPRLHQPKRAIFAK